MTENIKKLFSRWCDGYGYDEDSDEDLSLYRTVEKELSNLMKIKPLEWKLVPGCDATWYADSIFGKWTAWEIGEGYFKPPFGYAGIRVEGDLKAAQDKAFEVYKNLIMSTFEQ